MVGADPPDINTLLVHLSGAPLTRADALEAHIGSPPRGQPSATLLRLVLWCGRKMADQSKSLLLSLAAIYETFLISFPTVVDAALGRVDKDVCDRRLDGWGKKIVAHAKMDVEVVGREHISGGKTFLVMSNHQSHYDIPVMFYVMGPNLRMITKTELFKVPVWGPAMRESGFIAIDRGNRHKALESLEVARNKIASGVHIWIAPEGTRSRTGQLLPFKKGGFALALDAGLPILPVAIKGTRDALVADGVRSTPGAKVRVTLFAPIDPSTYSANNEPKVAREKLMADVRRVIESGL
jgi:1-acyl-sn-glycerol-3-phosphate acyltransferase